MKRLSAYFSRKSPPAKLARPVSSPFTRKRFKPVTRIRNFLPDYWPRQEIRENNLSKLLADRIMHLVPPGDENDDLFEDGFESQSLMQLNDAYEHLWDIPHLEKEMQDVEYMREEFPYLQRYSYDDLVGTPLIQLFEVEPDEILEMASFFYNEGYENVEGEEDVVYDAIQPEDDAESPMREHGHVPSKRLTQWLTLTTHHLMGAPAAHIPIPTVPFPRFARGQDPRYVNSMDHDYELTKDPRFKKGDLIVEIIARNMDPRTSRFMKRDSFDYYVNMQRLEGGVMRHPLLPQNLAGFMIRQFKQPAKNRVDRPHFGAIPRIRRRTAA
jgi:hypothetical protein